MPGIPSISLFPHAATLRRAIWGASGGARTPQYLETQVAIAIQPMKHGRAVRYDMPVGISAFVVYFRSDPGLAVDDQVIWQGRTLAALAPPRDEGGVGSLWSVDCREIA